MKKKTLTTLGLSIVLALGLVGCGSSAGETETTTEAAVATTEEVTTESSEEVNTEVADSDVLKQASVTEAEKATASDPGYVYTGNPVTIKVGASITPHSEILEQAKPILEKQGITLEIVQLEDYITPNTGVIEGSLDANYFQHTPYLEQFNSENGSDIVSIGAVHYEPFGVYAGKTSSLADLKEGAIVAVPNDVTNEARALLLLEQEGILKLK